MQQSMRNETIASCFLVAQRSCLVLGMTASAGSALALTGSDFDQEGRFGAVVRFADDQDGLCTATKIAPLVLLTAAHCVTDLQTGRSKAGFEPGGVLHISNAPDPERAAPEAVTLDAVLLHPDYQQGLARFVAYKASRISAPTPEGATAGLPELAQALRIRHHFSSRYPDIALLRLRTPTPSIPTLSLDFAAPPEGAEVLLVGYGCQIPPRLGDVRQRGGGRRSWGRSRVIRADGLNLYSEGGQMRPGAPSLCPGDSGGPVLYRGRVVGVHSVVYGLNARHGARSNMAARVGALAGWAGWPAASRR